MRRLLLLAALIPLMAIAQEYPSRAIRLVVPFPPGGSTDVVARLLAAKLSEGFKQPVVVENTSAAGSTLGTEQVAKAASDGYTLLITALPSIVTGPFPNREVRYDPLKAIRYLAMLGSFP